ncbi:MAG: hypothetical protein ACLS6O_05180 [Bifidobacterium sp.]
MPFADTVRSSANEPTIENRHRRSSMVRGAARTTPPWPSSPTQPLCWSPPRDGTGFFLDERKWLAAKAFATPPL